MDNLNVVKEMVLDEDKLVTYISLSKELCIHVNTSKMLLHKVLQNIRQDKPNIDLKVSFLISGLTNNNIARVAVCPEATLEDLRSSFKVVHFEHIYGISKGAIDDLLLANNHYDDLNLCSGSLKNSSCVKHSAAEINNFKSSSLVVSEAKPSLAKPITPHKKVKAEAPEKVVNGNNNFLQGKNVQNTEAKVKKEKQSPKKDSPSPRKETTKQNNEKINGKKPQKGIAGFFNNTSNSSKKPTPEVPKKVVPSESKVKIEKMEIDEENSDVETKSSTNTNGIRENGKQSKNTNHESKKSTSKDNVETDKNKKLNEIKKSSKVDKKRKRVLHVSDSDSDNKSDTEKEAPEPVQDSDDEIPPTPMANNIKITSGMVNPRKKRKVIDKTYQDEEGYILTKKVEVYESCSDEENVSEVQNIQEPKVKEEKKEKEVMKEISPKSKAKQKSTKKKISSPQKGKQATLMNFFKRK